jgi:hypothetical protein
MPCRDYYTDEERYRLDEEDLRERLDKVTELLCFTLNNINDAWFNGVSFRYYTERDPFESPLETELMDWWTEHQQLDAEEKTREEAELAEEKAREETELAEEKRREEILAKVNELFSEEELLELRDIL